MSRRIFSTSGRCAWLVSSAIRAYSISLGLNLDLRGLAEALVDGRLVDEHTGVQQHQALALVPEAGRMAAAGGTAGHTVCTSGLMYCMVS